MERVVESKFPELISASFDILPLGIANRLRYTHFFTGVDPVYAGLFDFHKSKDGRSYRNIWCVAYPEHLMKVYKKFRQTTIIMPEFDRGYPIWVLPMIMIHELGHVLDEILGFTHIAEPVTEYAIVDRREAFSEAFTSWLNPGYNCYYNVVRSVDEETLSLFQRLDELWR